MPAPPAPPSPPPLEGLVIQKRWKILNVLGKGAFGEVHAALDLHTNTRFAMKIEPPSAKKQVLKLEIAVLRKLATAVIDHGATPWFADFVASGRFAITASKDATPKKGQDGKPAAVPVYSFMVMGLLGPNLSEIRRQTLPHRFPLATTSHLTVQMLHSIETLHAVGVVHRDIKPGNFCVAADHVFPSTPLESTRVYVIDFGLSRRYLSSSTGAIRPARTKVGFRGTSRYASLRAHDGCDLGPVDDLWSLLYLTIEFVTGVLPWKGKEKDHIAAIKVQHHGTTRSRAGDDGGSAKGDPPRPTPLHVGQKGHITHGLPPPLTRLWTYLSTLDYEDPPDYRRIEKELLDLARPPSSHLQQPRPGDPSAATVALGMARAEGEKTSLTTTTKTTSTGPAVSKGSTSKTSAAAIPPSDNYNDNDMMVVDGHDLDHRNRSGCGGPPLSIPLPPPPPPPPPASTETVQNVTPPRTPAAVAATPISKDLPPTLPPLPVYDPHLIPR
ncbi:Tau-tubulin kinase 2 [Thoreauomyces humboldtii]|nr:Tau-tubulin kinase 2 [Thoreauomyces humboldtii]